MDKVEDFLMHHGIKGQKWGDRRFQYEDGTLTPEGKLRYRDDESERRYAQYGPSMGQKIQVSNEGENEAAAKAYGYASTRKLAGAAGEVGGTVYRDLAKDKNASAELAQVQVAAKKLSNGSDEKANQMMNDYYDQQMRIAKNSYDLSDYDTQDLKRWNDRLRTEKEYKDLTFEQTKEGLKKVQDSLGTLTGLLGVAVAGASLVYLVKKIKKEG